MGCDIDHIYRSIKMKPITDKYGFNYGVENKNYWLLFSLFVV